MIVSLFLTQSLTRCAYGTFSRILKSYAGYGKRSTTASLHFNSIQSIFLRACNSFYTRQLLLKFSRIQDKVRKQPTTSEELVELQAYLGTAPEPEEEELVGAQQSIAGKRAGGSAATGGSKVGGQSHNKTSSSLQNRTGDSGTGAGGAGGAVGGGAASHGVAGINAGSTSFTSYGGFASGSFSPSAGVVVELERLTPHIQRVNFLFDILEQFHMKTHKEDSLLRWNIPIKVREIYSDVAKRRDKEMAGLIQKFVDLLKKQNLEFEDTLGDLEEMVFNFNDKTAERSSAEILEMVNDVLTYLNRV